MHSFEVHSNESACRKKVRLGLEQVFTFFFIGRIPFNVTQKLIYSIFVCLNNDFFVLHSSLLYLIFLVGQLHSVRTLYQSPD